jgi:MYXO-CTERM domain-containing protein
MGVLNAYGNDPVEADAGTNPVDAGTVTEAGGPEESGTLDAGARDAGVPVGVDAAPPIQQETPPVPRSQESSGCSAAPAGAASPIRGAWLATIGLVLGITRRRRGRRV